MPGFSNGRENRSGAVGMTVKPPGNFWPTPGSPHQRKARFFVRLAGMQTQPASEETDIASTLRPPNLVNVGTLPVARIIECGLAPAAVSLLERRCLFVDGGNRGLCHGLRCLEDAALEIFSTAHLEAAPVELSGEIRNAVKTWEEPYATHD
jgi:hypothetical protein